MPDPSYKEYAFLFQSKGIAARPTDDTLEQGQYLNLDNCEELAENSFSQRLGSIIVNRTGSAINALDGIVNSLGKLGGLNGQVWRYAATSAGSLWRRNNLGQGPYTRISSTVSGNPMWMVSYRPDISSSPYMFFADTNGMLKDNGALLAPQQMGIFQPQFPCTAQAGTPDIAPLDPLSGNVYTTSGVSAFTSNTVVNTTTTTTAVTAPGIQEVNVADVTKVGQFKYVQFDTGANKEMVLILTVTATGFTANFNRLHASGVTVQESGLTGTVAAQSTGIVSAAFAGKPVSTWPTNLSLDDYISLYFYLTDQTQIQSILLKFDCGDGTFNSDYFYKIIGQGALQSLLDQTTQPTTAATDVVLADSLDLYGNSESSVLSLASGLNVWSSLLAQLSDFAGAGRADFNDPVYNWQNINGYQITIVVSGASSISFKLASLVLFGGAGPDTLGGVAYDYVFTFYNDNDGTESNPSMTMTNVAPPNLTNWVYPRRMPVFVSCNLKTYGPGGVQPDFQVTAVRLYRRGGTLGDNYRRVVEVPVTIATGNTIEIEDLTPDEMLAGADIVSFTNDVPVTSSLPNPVNTTLNAALIMPGRIQNIVPASMANISVRQQVTLGSPTNFANNFETVIVLQVFVDHFTAYVQNNHAISEQVQATAKYGQPVNIMALAYNQMWFAGDPNNPSYLYYSAGSNPQAVGSANFVEVSSPDDPIIAIVPYKGNLYVSTLKFWWAIAPGTNANATPTIYPTAAKHGCVAPFGFLVTEEGIYYQAIDGIRFYAGGASTYLTQPIEFLFQGVGTSPIVQANPNLLNQTVAAYWNNMMFFSYVGLDGDRHRVIAHSEYKRWRNDDFDCQSILLEADTNTLVVGDSVGLVHLDRQNVGYDEGATGTTLTLNGIAMDLQTPFNFMSTPDIQKQYNEVTLDCFTAGQNIALALVFDDGQLTIPLGNANTTQRQKVNFNVNAGAGQNAYKVSLQITGAPTTQVYLYQCSIKALPLAKTRKSMDTYQLRLGIDESKVAKQVYIEYTATPGNDITFNVFYEGSATAGFTFTLPNNGGVRNALRIRLPAVSFRMIRLIGTSAGDFQVWETSKIEWKPQCSGKGYQVVEFVPN